MNTQLRFIKLDSQWTLVHESIVAQAIGITEDIFARYFAPIIPKIDFDGITYYANFDINWRIQQLRTRNINITEINNASK